jgi:fructan beta-fructosidase
VILAADAQYAIGRFDGRTFTPDHEGKHRVHWGKYYASQTFENAPDGRRIQIGWVQIAAPGMPFNQTFSFPHELTLRSTGDGMRLFAQPIREIEKLHRKRHRTADRQLAEDAPARLAVSGELFEVRVTFELGDAKRVGLDIGGNRITYDTERNQLGEAPLKPVDGRITLQVLVDRPLMEICGNAGRVFITSERPRKGEVRSIEAFAEGGGANLIVLEADELESIWR